MPKNVLAASKSFQTCKKLFPVDIGSSLVVLVVNEISGILLVPKTTQVKFLAFSFHVLSSPVQCSGFISSI